MAEGTLRLALVHEVFFGDGASDRLEALLSNAAGEGADLAVLPELPFDRWIPATRQARDDDAEPPGGPHEKRTSEAARRHGIGLLGGAIVSDAGIRRNRALLADASGKIIARYDKLHVPLEEGFWERDHYEPGSALTRPCPGFGLKVGLQICSDMQRPQAVTALAAMGAEVIFAPRATPTASHERWRIVLRAAAVAGACYVVSINRPRPENGVGIGSPSLIIAPDGEVLVETEEPLTVTTLDRETVLAARKDYPGYLDVRSDLYANVWRSLG